MNINDLLRIYLGTDENGGYEPIYREERFCSAFPSDHKVRIKEIEKYLDFDMEPDWTRGDLNQETNRFETELRKAFPELEPIIAKALSNRFSYSWK